MAICVINIIVKMYLTLFFVVVGLLSRLILHVCMLLWRRYLEKRKKKSTCHKRDIKTNYINVFTCCNGASICMILMSSL